MNNLSQIQTFLEVARLSSFAKAARRLSLPRTTVTARVQALEERLNVRLFHRTTRAVSLTEEGRQYFASCENAVDILLQAEDALASSIEPTGPIRMSVPIDFPKAALADLLCKFQEEHPAITFTVDVSDGVVDLVGDNYDLVLRGRDPGTPGLVVRKIMSGKMAFFASPNWYKPASKMAKNLLKLNVLDPANILNKSSVYGNTFPSIQTENFMLAKSIALSSQYVALLPENLCLKEIEVGDLIKINSPINLAELPLYLVMPSRAYIPTRTRIFIDFLVSRANTF
ncbi:MAG: LysR family transcriptional regulator [Sneathiella sp.]